MGYFLGARLNLSTADEFWWAIEKSLLNDVDPCFVSSLLAALVAGFEMLDESVTHICGRPIEECEALVPRWTAACNQALALGNWTAVPQYRVIQVLIMASTHGAEFQGARRRSSSSGLHACRRSSTRRFGRP